MRGILYLFLCAATGLFGAAEKSTTGILKSLETPWGALSIEGACDATGYGAAVQSWSKEQGRNTTGGVAVIAAGQAPNLLVPSIAMLLPMYLDSHDAKTALRRVADDLNTQYTSPLVVSSLATCRLSALGLILIYEARTYRGVVKNQNDEANVVPYISLEKISSYVSSAPLKVAFATKRDDKDFPSAPVILWKPKK